MMMAENERYDLNNDFNHNYNPDYDRIKSYLKLLRNDNGDQKDMAENFFKNNKNEKYMYFNLVQIAENGKETDDVRLHSMVKLKQLYNYTIENYIRYDKPKDDLEEVIQNALPVGDINAYSNNNHNTQHKKRNFNSLIDNLPYIDQANAIIKNKEEAHRLINEEMENMKYNNKTKNYLEHLTYPHLNYLSNPLIVEEFSRIEKNKKLNVINPEINTNFELPPPNKLQDETNWNKLINDVNTSMQHYSIKNFNLDILIKYGPAVWKKFLANFECLIAQMENEKSKLEQLNNEINQKRKFSQVKNIL